MCSIVAKNLKCNFSPEEWQYTVLIYRNKKYEQINSDFKYVTGGEELQKQKEENQNKKTNETQEEVYLKKEKPRIGMTTEEVENSEWGKPNDINTTITNYGTSEQWVYGNGRYIYFDDGVVTAIQE